MDWLEQSLGDFDDDYVLFDCPGIQISDCITIQKQHSAHKSCHWDFPALLLFRFALLLFACCVLEHEYTSLSVCTAHTNQLCFWHDVLFGCAFWCVILESVRGKPATPES